MNKINLNLLISTIIILKQSTLKEYLFKVMMKLNKLSIKNYFNESMNYNLNTDIIEDINIILENIDDWIRHYNSEMRMSMNKELIINLAEIKKMFYVTIE